MVNCINLIIEMGPRFILGRENVPCVAEVVNRSLKADFTDFTNIIPESFFIFGSITMSIWYKIQFTNTTKVFDILSRFNLHMRSINLLETIR